VIDARWLLVGATLLAIARPGVARADEVEACATAAEEGQTLRDKGALIESKQRLIRCAQSSCPKVIRDDCSRWLPEVEARIPSIVVRVVDPNGDDVRGARVLRDGKPWPEALGGSAIAVDPGPATLRVEVDGRDPIDKEIVVAEGQRGRIVEIRLPPVGAPPPSTEAPSQPPAEKAGGGSGPFPWVFVGVGVAGMATFGVLQGIAAGEVSDIEEGCGATRTCSDEDLDPTRAKLVGSAIGLGVGIAGLGAAVITFALGGGDDAPAGSAIRVTPSASPAFAGAAISGPLSF
jgi:hypothetical protein